MSEPRIPKRPLHQWRMCRRKKTYGNTADAEDAAMRFRQRAYRCHYCGWFHLTSQKPKESA